MVSKDVVQLEVNYQVEIEQDQQRYLKAAQWVAATFNLSSLQVSIAIVDDPTIHQLNREHLEHDWPTDVISFIFEADEESGCVEGEIIASADTATRLAAAAQWRPLDELLLYIVHGLLHLAGLDDIEGDQQAEMRKAERDCLTALRVQGAERVLQRWDDVSY